MKTRIKIALFTFIIVSCNSEEEKPVKETTKSFPDKIELSAMNDSLLADIIAFKDTFVFETIECKGEVQPAYYAQAAVSTPIHGIIADILVNEGSFVTKGETVAIIQHQDIIELQKEYLSLKHELEFLEEEFKRQGELSIEEAASMKKMQLAKANYWSKKAQFNATEAQLLQLNINPAALENGFVSKIRLIAPISGYVEALKAVQGQFINPDQAVMRISNPFILDYYIDIKQENYFTLNKKAQVTIHIDGFSHEIVGEIVQLGKYAKKEKIIALVRSKETHDQILPGMKVKAVLQTNDFSAIAIPKTAVFEENKWEYIYILKNNMLQKTKINSYKHTKNFVIIQTENNNFAADSVLNNVLAQLNRL